MNYNIDKAIVVGKTVVTDDIVEVYLRLTTGETIALYGDVEGMNIAPLPTLYKRKEDLEETNSPLLDMNDEELTSIAKDVEDAIIGVLASKGLTANERQVFWEMWRNRWDQS